MLTRHDLPAIDPGAHATRRATTSGGIVVLGVVAGAGLGAVARGWMRLVSDDPGFSWSGTIFIVLAFTVAGAGHGVARAVRRAGVRRRWSTTARVAAIVLTLPIFTGAGAMMLPTVLGASAAGARRDWPRAVRAVALALAVPAPVVIVGQLAADGLTPRRLLGVLLLVATYAVIVRNVRATLVPVDDGWRMSRRVRLLVTVSAAVLLALVVLSSVGVATGDS